MAAPDFTMRQLLEAGAHFGHQTHRWNPKMSPFIYGARNNIHIMDLTQTVPMLHRALQAVSDTVANGGRVLFVGTKRQASETVADAAKRSAQYYVNARWLGGMLTNWNTISNSIKRLRKVDEILDSEAGQHLTKKERLTLTRERDKLERALGGIKDMGGTPDMMFVIDTNKEAIAVLEARRLKIPVVAVLDSNCDPAGIDFPIPGNDDAARAIALYCDLVSKAAIDGIARQQGATGVDIGAAAEAPVEKILEAVEAEPVSVEAAVDISPGEAEPAKAAEPVEAEVAPAVEAKTADAVEETKEEAKKEPKAQAAPDSAPVALFDAPEGDADDLKLISGVGPVLEEKLNATGIRTFAQIAAFTAEDIAKIDEHLNFKGRVERDGWVEQAGKLAAGE